MYLNLINKLKLEFSQLKIPINTNGGNLPVMFSSTFQSPEDRIVSCVIVIDCAQKYVQQYADFTGTHLGQLSMQCSNISTVTAYNPAGAGGVPATMGHSVDEMD